MGMRAQFRPIVLAIFNLLLLACTAEVTHDDRVREQSWEHPAPYPASDPAKGDGLAVGGFIVFDRAGRAQWLDPQSGAISALEREGKPSDSDVQIPRDAIYDPWHRRVLVFLSDEDDQSGEIVTFPFARSPAELEPREHFVWVDGRVRMLAVPEGLVLFEQSYGERWRLLRADAEPTSSRATPRPVSAFALIGSGSSVVHGLVAGEEGPQWLSAPLTQGGFGERRARPLPGLPVDARVDEVRMAPLADRSGVAILHSDVEAAALWIHDGSALPMRIALPPLPGRLEQLEATPQGRLALLLAEPAGVMVIERNGTAVRHAHLRLPGLTEPSDGSLTRSLASAAPGRLLAATRAGVFAIIIHADGAELRLELDAEFEGTELRGPIAGPI
jgi:hypothetical protein